MSVDKPRRLGRGLEALIAGANTPGAASGSAAPASDLQRVPLGRIRANPFQPRREFDPEELADLEASIKASGLLQPITVRRAGDAYELVAGERRFRAVTNLGWPDVPAIVRDFDDQTMLVLALVENLQRTDLNPIDEARGYKRLTDEFGYSQQQIADAIGKDRTTVANLVRLLALPQKIQRMLELGHLTPGHARPLLSVGDEKRMLDLANEIVARGLTVRDVEARTRQGEPKPTAPRSKPAQAAEPATLDPSLRAVQDDLRRHLQTDVQIALNGPDKGTLRIAFYSAEDFDRLLDLILGSKRGDF